MVFYGPFHAVVHFCRRSLILKFLSNVGFAKSSSHTPIYYASSNRRCHHLHVAVLLGRANEPMMLAYRKSLKKRESKILTG